ncbi:MAG: VWA domain-containing protein [Spirochaetales bacterium]|nr:VWA domain-containing protein [Spirochaetales bacterium]
MHRKFLTAFPLLFIPVFFILFVSCEPAKLPPDEAVKKLDRLLNNVNVYDAIVRQGDTLITRENRDLKASLPDIDKFPMTVDPRIGIHDEAVSVFVSTEKSGRKEPDNWLTIMTERFNDRQVKLSNGNTAKVIVRSIASGTGHEYIASGKYFPTAFSPSNILWVNMVSAYGVKMTPVADSLVNNTAGIIMKNAVYDRLTGKYGELNIKNLITAVVQGDLRMGYTNPYASSTGLNFLISVLNAFADGDESKMLTEEVISSFESFQRGVPFVALTTLQMRESVEKNGSLDAFVMEYQTFVNTQVLSSGYRFIPFGVKHSNPLYAVGDIPAIKMEVLRKYAAFLKERESRDLADRYGFNKLLDYEYNYPTVSGNVLISAQQLWKEKKDSGRPILAVFLSDVSGSMNGIPLDMLKAALIEGSHFISSSNYIGLVTFSSEVTRLLEVRKFDDLHRSVFVSAVKKMSAGGSTAMYDGIAVSLKMLNEAKTREPSGKPMLFLLTDGDSNRGMSLGDIENVIAGLEIPIYTIGYNANIEVLNVLSNINEAATIVADDENIGYKLGAMLNAEM